MKSSKNWSAVAAAGVVVAGGWASVADAGSIVRFDTVFGDFDVELFDEEAPLHVENFLEYVDSGAYDNSIVHRNSSDDFGNPFVIQGGLATYDGSPQVDPNDFTLIETLGTVTNEPGISNTRGTIALARVSGQVNSGTSQWFINLDDNSFLDTVDEGFTVFGEIIGDGLTVVDQIAALNNAVFNSPYGELPVRNISSQEEFDALLGGDGLTDNELVLINSITLLEDTQTSEETETETPTDSETETPTETEEPEVEEPAIDVPEEPIDVVTDDETEEESMFPEEEVETPVDTGDDSGGSNGGSSVVPTPSALLAGLLGLGVVASRRRRM